MVPTEQGGETRTSLTDKFSQSRTGVDNYYVSNEMEQESINI